ncbi:MAG TPA: RNA-binding protein [Dehalococcoidia bacterium]
MAKKKRDYDFSVNALRVVREATGDTEYKATGKNPAAVALGRLGGLKRSQQLTPEQRKELAQKAAKARWEKKS